MTKGPYSKPDLARRESLAAITAVMVKPSAMVPV